MEMDDHSRSQSVLSMFLKWGHSEGGAGMQFTRRCGNADALIWIYSRQGSCEGGLFQSFLLALECEMLGSDHAHSTTAVRGVLKK